MADWLDRRYDEAELRDRIAAIRAQHRAIVTRYQAEADQHQAAVRDHLIAARAAMDQAEAASDAATRLLAQGTCSACAQGRPAAYYWQTRRGGIALCTGCCATWRLEADLGQIARPLRLTDLSR